jgi:hypothetical protein
MPTVAVVLWLVTGGLCFILGTYFLWKTERSGVRRWGACGRLFHLGTRRSEDSQGAGDGNA